MFLGKEDIQLGVNETLEDSAKVIGSMVDGIMARVYAHEEVEVRGLFWEMKMSRDLISYNKPLPRPPPRRHSLRDLAYQW